MLGSTTTEITINLIKMVVVFLMMVQLVPILVWVERRVAGFVQNRFGPNRIGPLGLVQLLADAVKFLNKEDFIPEKGNKFLFYAAPVFALIPGAVAYMAIPMSTPFKTESATYLIQGYHVNIAIVYILGVSSLAVYTMLMAGWGSSNKFSLMGAMRASAQVISYELALGLSIVGIILTYGTFDLTQIIQAQDGALSFTVFGREIGTSLLPNWGIFYQPLGAFLFLAASFAESNRLPFDLAEGEAELVAGFHTEYGGFKMLMFFLGEYGHMMVAAGLMTTFYFGGYGIPYWSTHEVFKTGLSLFGTETGASLFSTIVHFISYNVKFLLFLWVFIQVRWTLPRFRYDQLMDLGWKTMLPWALFNTILTATVIFVTSQFVL